MSNSFPKTASEILRTRGATIIIALGISVLMVAFSIGVGFLVRNNVSTIKAFKNQWQSRLLAESMKEQLLSDAKGFGAGYSLEQGTSGTTATGCAAKINALIANIPGLTAANISGKCSIEGKNSVAVKDSSDATWYTVPTANTGEAGMECNPLMEFTTPGSLTIYNTTTITDAVTYLFNGNPLNHPCNWGKLKFGNNFGSRVAVPLYYTKSTGETVNPVSPDLDLQNLILKVRTPCKPWGERVNCKETATGNRLSTPYCKYDDICKDTDRYALSTASTTPIIQWQITGECIYDISGAQSGLHETCTLFPDTGTQITASIVNFVKDNLMYKVLFQDSQGKDVYTANPTPITGTILSFITNAEEWSPDTNPDKKINAANITSRTITKPVFQISLVANSLKSSDNTKNIPYLEYQIVTDKPISNFLQIFVSEINFEGQAQNIQYSVDQKKNVVDFALQE